MISVIIPWIRENGLVRCINAITENAGMEDYEIIAEDDKDRIGVPLMVKRLVNKTNYNLVMFLADDIVPQKDFMINALKHMLNFEGGWGLVGLNDQNFKETPATHWLAHKKLLDYLDGEFFNINYIHNFVDNELTDRCIEINRYKWAEDSIIEHKHPAFDNEVDFDRDYKRVYNLSSFYRDKRLYNKRKENKWRN